MTIKQELLKLMQFQLPTPDDTPQASPRERKTFASHTPSSVRTVSREQVRLPTPDENLEASLHLPPSYPPPKAPLCPNNLHLPRMPEAQIRTPMLTEPISPRAFDFNVMREEEVSTVHKRGQDKSREGEKTEDEEGDSSDSDGETYSRKSAVRVRSVRSAQKGGPVTSLSARRVPETKFSARRGHKSSAGDGNNRHATSTVVEYDHSLNPTPHVSVSLNVNGVSIPSSAAQLEHGVQQKRNVLSQAGDSCMNRKLAAIACVKDFYADSAQLPADVLKMEPPASVESNWQTCLLNKLTDKGCDEAEAASVIKFVPQPFLLYIHSSFVLLILFSTEHVQCPSVLEDQLLIEWAMSHRMLNMEKSQQVKDLVQSRTRLLFRVIQYFCQREENSHI